MIRVTIFVVGSVALVTWSRRSLLHRQSYGFRRFLAFEFILALILINLPVWFVRPFRPGQLASWLFLTTSGVFVVCGFAQLRRLGGFQPSAEAHPESDSTDQLVTTGLYGYIRHPLYSSLLFLSWGALLKAVTVATLLLAAAASATLVLTAQREERENRKRFGEAYDAYSQRTRRFIPFLF